jgi:hypothetical protein
MREWIGVRAIRALWASFLVFAAVYASAEIWPVTGSVRDTILAIAYLLPTGAAALGTLYAAIARTDKEKIFWACLSAGFIAFFLGELYWAFLQVMNGADGVANLSFSSLAFLVGYGFFFLSLIALMRLQPVKQGTRHTLFVVVSLSAVGMLTIWYFQSAPLYSSYSHLEKTSEIINIFYPVLDVGLIVGIVSLAIMKYSFRWPPWLVSIAIGFTIYAFGDVAFAYFALAGAYNPGAFLSNVIDVLWMSSYIFMVNASLINLRLTEDIEEEEAAGY